MCFPLPLPLRLLAANASAAAATCRACCIDRPQVYFANHPSKFAAKAADTSAKTFDAFMMFSANYDPGRGGGQALPNSAYHMNLQQARFTLSATFSDKLETRYKEEKTQALAN